MNELWYLYAYKFLQLFSYISLNDCIMKKILKMESLWWIINTDDVINKVFCMHLLVYAMTYLLLARTPHPTETVYISGLILNYSKIAFQVMNALSKEEPFVLYQGVVLYRNWQ